ncbi:hypothetical protein F4Y93_12740 [Candidatus Poribacteria bacterium]|nr:hypothetical protein [Candidatus Poribacteria bacterium]
MRLLRALLVFVLMRLFATSTYDQDDMIELYGATTVAELRQNSMMLMLCSQADTMEWANGNAASAKIPIPDWAYTADADSTTGGAQPAGVRAVDRARGGAWTPAISGQSGTLKFERTDGTQTANEIDVEDIAELPWPVQEETRSRQQYVLRRSVDLKLHNAWIGAIGTGAGEQTTLGGASDTISRTAPYDGAGDGYGLVYDSLVAYSLKMERAGVYATESDSVGRIFAKMPPEFWVGFERWMLEQKFSWDELTEEMLVQGRSMGMGNFRKRMKGIDIFSDNNIAVPTSGNWSFFFGVRDACRANIRRLPGYQQMFQPTSNQISDHPATLMRQAVDIGFLAISDGDLAQLNHRYIIRGA